MASPPPPRIFLDSSVLFAAAASATGASRALVILAELGLLRLIAAKDAPILAAAISAQPDRLVTLDIRDFGCPEVQRSVPLLIQTPGELLADIRQALVAGLGRLT